MISYESYLLRVSNYLRKVI